MIIKIIELISVICGIIFLTGGVLFLGFGAINFYQFEGRLGVILITLVLLIVCLGITVPIVKKQIAGLKK